MIQPQRSCIFNQLLSINGPGLVEKGIVSIWQHQHWGDQYKNESLLKICDRNDSNVYCLLTNPNNYLVIDLKASFPISGLIIRGTTSAGYPWTNIYPSYALEFSNDNETFEILYQENLSSRISDSNLFTEYFFGRIYYFRYFRLRVLSQALDWTLHGQYFSWLDFYPAYAELFSRPIRNCHNFNIFYLMAFILIYET